MSDMTPFPIAVKLRAGHAVVDGTAWRADLPALIEQSNRKARLDGLPDHLNPEIIDPEKAAAFLAALAKRPAAALQPLAGRTLFLNYAGLMLGASAPIRAATFAEPFEIEVADVQGEVVLARLILRVDPVLARERATEARVRIRSADAEVKALEAQLSATPGTSDKEREVLVSLSMARSRRYAIARVWLENAEAWVHGAKSDSVAKADLEAAASAAKSYFVLSGSGMP
jgi:hypothetical protein